MSAVVHLNSEPCIIGYDLTKAIPFPRDIMFNSELTFGERIFLADLKANAKSEKIPYTIKDLSEKFDVSQVTINNWLRKLTKLRILELGIDLENQETKHYLIIKK